MTLKIIAELNTDQASQLQSSRLFNEDAEDLEEGRSRRFGWKFLRAGILDGNTVEIRWCRNGMIQVIVDCMSYLPHSDWLSERTRQELRHVGVSRLRVYAHEPPGGQGEFTNGHVFYAREETL